VNRISNLVSERRLKTTPSGTRIMGRFLKVIFPIELIGEEPAFAA